MSKIDKNKITNRKIAQCFSEISEVGFIMPAMIEQNIKKWFHYLSDEIVEEISNNKDNNNGLDKNFNG